MPDAHCKRDRWRKEDEGLARDGEDGARPTGAQDALSTRVARMRARARSATLLSEPLDRWYLRGGGAGEGKEVARVALEQLERERRLLACFLADLNTQDDERLRYLSTRARAHTHVGARMRV